MANVRFFRRGVTRVWFSKQCSVSGSPATLNPSLTANDLRSTTPFEARDLTPYISDMTGFSFANTPIPVPDLTDNFDAQIPGVDAAAASMLKFYERRSTDTSGAGSAGGADSATLGPGEVAQSALRTAVAKGQSGFIVIFWGGCKNDGSGNAGATPTAGDKCEVWPSTSTGPAREYVMTPNAGIWSATFSISARPNVDAAVVA